MAVSHVCTGCGLDVARVRSAPDPHYGLALVICPRCSTASVRRHVSRIGWSGARRMRRTLLLLGLQVGLLGLTGALTVTACLPIGFGELRPREVLAELMAVLRGDEDLLFAGSLIGAGALIAWSGLVGVWLGAGFRHLGVPGAVVRWGLYIQILLGLVVLVRAAVEAAGPGPGDTLGPRMRWADCAATGATITLLTLLGVPMGVALRRSLDRRRARWIVNTRRRRRGGSRR